MPSIRFDHVSLVHDGLPVVNDVALDIVDGELLTIVGPSGSGKSTLLRLIAGLERPTSGRVLIDGEDMSRADSSGRNVAMVFQDHALYAHKTAEANLRFPLQLRGIGEPEQSRRVSRVARTLRLSRLVDRLPRTLSVGQRNAVATGRALVRDPAILLLDEPLANLDASTRKRTRAEIRRRHDRGSMTTVYATNDQEEAMALGDRTVVFSRGIVQQIDTPQAIYLNPANVFVARFIGSPPMNVLRGVLERSPTGLSWTHGADRLVIPEDVLTRYPPESELIGRDVLVGIRPEHLVPSLAEPFDACLHGTCVRIEDQGENRFAFVDLGDETVVGRLGGRRPDPGVGNPAELAVDLENLHFFDAHSGATL